MGRVSVAVASREDVSSTFYRNICTESREMWEKVQNEDCLENVTRASQQGGGHQKIAEEKKPIDKEDPQPVKIVQTHLPPIPSTGADIFPRKKKGGLVNIKPAHWEKNSEKLKNTILKKEKRE